MSWVSRETIRQHRESVRAIRSLERTANRRPDLSREMIAEAHERLRMLERRILDESRR